jgi:hypothetical protein
MEADERSFEQVAGLFGLGLRGFRLAARDA